MKQIRVSLKERSYPIYVGYNIMPRLKKLLSSGKGVIVTDKNVNSLWGKEIRSLGLPVCVIPSGERSKCLSEAENIYRKLLEYGLDRHGFIVAVGGGVVGDLAGFVASTYMRGVSCVQVPTTLMSQVDSSIGGKTGVNLPEGKNLVGCFWQPKFVFIDVRFLTTLPKKELKSGLAEVIKYGVIRDNKLFRELENYADELYTIEPKMWIDIVSRCAKIKADVVSRDERETKGLRVILNYGHTIGHAIESALLYKGVTHGEAVAIGMVLAAKLSNSLGYLSDEDTHRHNLLIDSLLSIDREIDFKDIEGYLKRDKKAKDGKVRFVLADKIGHVFVKDGINSTDLMKIF